MFILSRKHLGATQHWEPLQVKGTIQNVDFEWKTYSSQTTQGIKQHKEPCKVKGTTQNIDFEWKTHWNQTTLGAIKSEGNHPKCWFWVENTLEPNNTWNHKKVKGATQNVHFKQKALMSQTTLGTITSKGNHPNCWFWIESPLEPNKTGNHRKWRKPPKKLIFEWETHWSQTILGTIKSEGNRTKCSFWAERT